MRSQNKQKGYPMSSALLRHFTRGTERTETGTSMGFEVETHFVMEDGTPIPSWITMLLIGSVPPGPWRITIDLGRQLIELAIDPHPSRATLLTTTLEALDWLYRLAAHYGARPLFEPVLSWDGDLLLIQEKRDELWTKLDGRRALEHLCRPASVQPSISVAPSDAVRVINRAWAAGLHKLDYPNDALWCRYIEGSVAGYRPDRYAGPTHFESIKHYVQLLSLHAVVMHNDQACRLHVNDLGDDFAALVMFLRSVWWHFRLRVHGDILAIEFRPFARRADSHLEVILDHAIGALNI